METENHEINDFFYIVAWVILISGIAMIPAAFILSGIDFGSLEANARYSGTAGNLFIGGIVLIVIGFLLFIPTAGIKNQAKYEKELETRNRRNRSLVTTLAAAHALQPWEFEQTVGEIFRRLGYEVTPTQYVADGGADVILKKDGKTELVQCKRYKGNVSVQVVREFFGVMVDQGVTKGYVVTTGHFTMPARNFAQGKGIHLIDGPELAEMLEEIWGQDDRQQ